jgi:ferredoxin
LCDGLGACLGECPEGALTVEVREADEFDEAVVEERLRQLGRAPLLAGYTSEGVVTPSGHEALAPEVSLPMASAPRTGGCPGSLARDLRSSDAPDFSEPTASSEGETERPSESLLQNWPVQLSLVNPNAPFLRHSDLLIAADCAPAAYRLFHEDFLHGRSLVIACPKLDDAQAHRQKLALLLQTAKPRSVSVVRMEVPCCSGLVSLTRAAAELAGLDVPVQEIVIGVGGERLAPQEAVR